MLISLPYYLQEFTLPDRIFSVNRLKSGQGRVVISGIKVQAGDKPLRCEISGEAPFFQTDSHWATMRVVGKKLEDYPQKGSKHAMDYP